MATLFDAITVLKDVGFYSTVFPFILIAALLYGLFARYKPFGDNKTINSIISVVLGLFFISIFRASAFLANLVPLLTAFLLILIFLMLIFIFMGVKEDTIRDVILKEPAGYGTLIIIFVLIFFIVFGQTFPEQGIITQLPGVAKDYNISLIPPGATPTQAAGALLGAQMSAIITSPKILALILVMVLFGVASYYITREPMKSGGE